MTWELKPVSELCLLAVDCVNKTAPLSEVDTDYKMLRTTNIKNGYIDFDSVRYVEKDVFLKWTSRVQPKYGDVLFTREAPVGEVGRFTSKNGNYFLGQRTFLYRTDPNKLNWNYLAYVLQSEQIQGWINGIAYGATVPHLKVSDMEHLKIPVPSIEIQNKIAKILSNYDDRIENNLKCIKLLEESTRLTYEEWFLRFRIDGKKLEIDSETGLPFGWENKKAIELLNVKIGKTPPRGEAQWFTTDDKGVKWISIKDMKKSSTYVFNSSEKITSEGVTKYNMNLAKTGTVLLSFKLTVGEVRITTEDMVTNEAIAHMNIKKDSILFEEYIFLYLKSFNFDTLGSTSSIGTAINSQIVKAMPIIVPTKRTLEQFEKVAKLIFHEINNLQIQNQLLRESRDILLPRLMTGMIDVEELEVAV